MAWDWTSQTLDPVALVRVKYRDAAGEVAYARWSGPGGRAGSGVMWEDPDGLATGVQSWEARLVGGMTIEESLGPIDRPELSLGNQTLQVRCPASSTAGESRELRAALLQGRWENAEVVVWAADRDTRETIEVFRGTSPMGPSVADDERFTMALEALPFDLPNIEVPHTRIPSDVSEYTTTSTPSFPVFDPPANYVLHEQYRGKVVGPILGDPTSNSTYNWVEIVPFGVRNFSANHVGFYCHMSPHAGCFARDVAYEDDNGDITLVSDIMAAGGYGGPDLLLSYGNTDPTQGPTGSNAIVKVDATGSTASIQWLNQGRRFFARCYGAGTGDPDLSDLPFYQYTIPGNGETVPQGTLNTLERYDLVLEALLEGAEWANLSSIYGSGSISALYAAAPYSSGSFDNTAFVVHEVPAADPAKVRDVLAGASLALGLDLCPRIDTADGQIRLFPLWRQPQSASQTADWTLTAADLRKQSPARSLKLANDPDRSYANVVSVKSPSRFLPPLPEVDEMDRPPAQDEFTNKIASEVSLVGEVRKSVQVDHWQFKPDVAGGTPSGFSTSRFRIATDLAQPQPFMVFAGGLPLARIQVGDTVEYAIEGYPDGPGQVRSRSVDLGTGKVTIRSSHAIMWDVFEDGED